MEFNTNSKILTYTLRDTEGHDHIPPDEIGCKNTTSKEELLFYVQLSKFNQAD